MKRFLLLLTLLFITVECIYSLNEGLKVVATVDSYAITEYDINKMTGFLEATSGVQNVTKEAAFKELLYSYGLLALAEPLTKPYSPITTEEITPTADKSAEEKKIRIKQIEIDRFIDSITNIKDSEDPAAPYRLKLYQEFPNQFKLKNQKEQVMRNLLYNNNELKNKISASVNTNDMLTFYNKNRKSFIDTPMIDMDIVAIEQPKGLSLDELDNLEKSLLKISDNLKRDDDVDAILKNYPKLRTEFYTGRTGYRQAYELVKIGYPEEVINIPFIEKLQTRKGTIEMKVGSVFGPELVPLRKSGKYIYLIIKIIKKQPPKPMAFEKAKPAIENRLREERMESTIHEFIANKMEKREINVSIKDPVYESLYNKFVEGGGK